VSYASPSDFRSLTGHLDLDLPEDGSDAAVARLLSRASRDVEAFLAWPGRVDPNNPVGPLPDRITGLPSYEQEALRRAVCAQAAYRCCRDETELLEGQPSVISASGVQFATTAAPMVGPQTFFELAACPTLHWYRSGTVGPDGPPTDAPAAA
jgi:hypothetical protein